MPTSLFGTIQEGQRGPKRDQIFNFGILDPKNGLSKGDNKNKKVTRDIKTTFNNTIEVLCLFCLAAKHQQSPMSWTCLTSTKRPRGPKFGSFSCLIQFFNNNTSFYHFQPHFLFGNKNVIFISALCLPGGHMGPKKRFLWGPQKNC